MTLVKWNNRPSIFNDINHWFNQITDDYYNDQMIINKNWAPNFEVLKQKDHYLVIAELAGLTKDDINIELIENNLKISGERKTNKDDNLLGSSFSQINYGSFEKSFTLPEDVLENKITAKIEDGLLKIKIPTAKPVLPEIKRINIS